MQDNAKSVISRKKIMKTAIREFGANGYNGTSTNTLCEACGVSKGLVFYYFKTKKKLYLECAVYCINELDQYIKSEFKRSGNMMQDIKECCFLRKKYFMEHPDYFHIISEILYKGSFMENDGIVELQERYSRHGKEVIEKILEGVQLNPCISREECISWAVIMMHILDNEIEKKYQTNGNMEQMLKKQMDLYESFFEVMFYGILGNKQC